MANIVELRGMSDAKLEEMLENSREEMFNLRFQVASARLEDYTQLKAIRRQIAQLETVLNMRQLAIETAVANNVRKWRYIVAILERWRQEGKKDESFGRDSRRSLSQQVPDEYKDIVKR